MDYLSTAPLVPSSNFLLPVTRMFYKVWLIGRLGRSIEPVVNLERFMAHTCDKLELRKYMYEYCQAGHHFSLLLRFEIMYPSSSASTFGHPEYRSKSKSLNF